MDGKYTVSEVEERTGVPASSLRQWERRYGFPRPQRSGSGYRFYSDADLAAIVRMRELVAEGVPPSRAAAMVEESETGEASGRAPADLVNDLVETLVKLDSERAEATVSMAVALHPLDVVLLEVVRPTLIRIGDMWHAGSISVATEHFASNFLQGRLRSLLRLLADAPGGHLVIVACAPGELHEIGALIMAVMLRRSGFAVKYLGANTPITDLALLVRDQRADAVLISATTQAPIPNLRAERELLRSIPALLVLGGAAVARVPELAAEVGGVFLGNDARKVVPELRALLAKGR